MSGAFKVAAEVAELEFERMCAANRIEHDEGQLNDEERAEWREMRRKVVLDICRGQLVVSEDGRPTYTPRSGDSVTFHPATGATLMALETHGKGKDISNMIAAMTEMTRAKPGTFARMAAADFQACGRLARLFLADQ